MTVIAAAHLPVGHALPIHAHLRDTGISDGGLHGMGWNGAHWLPIHAHIRKITLSGGKIRPNQTADGERMQRKALHAEQQPESRTLYTGGTVLSRYFCG